MKRQKIKYVLEKGKIEERINIKGWIRTKRGSKNVAFLAINDGSTINNIQAVVDVDESNRKTLEKIHTGTSVSVYGELVESQGSGQRIELYATEIKVLGEADPDEYPLQPKKHSLEFLRDIAHLRFRTNLFGAVNRIRHAMIFGVHKFFNDKGFVNIHTPIITGSDCEGAGEMFRVSTLDPKKPPLNTDKSIDYSKDFLW